jgi:hypothetical protein
MAAGVGSEVGQCRAMSSSMKPGGICGAIRSSLALHAGQGMPAPRAVGVILAHPALAIAVRTFHRMISRAWKSPRLRSAKLGALSLVQPQRRRGIGGSRSVQSRSRQSVPIACPFPSSTRRRSRAHHAPSVVLWLFRCL